MSHFKERKETDCLNCGIEVQGRYCQICGQENIEPKETVWHLITHFIYDITHFDGKFFNSVKYLLFKPGFLPQEYLRGRRASYLNPIKMYVFISALFFLFFFSILQPVLDETKEKMNKGQTLLDKDFDTLKQLFDDTTQQRQEKINSQLTVLNDNVKKRIEDTAKSSKLPFQTTGKVTYGLAKKYDSVSQYDSIQNALADSKKDGWFSRKMIRKSVTIKERYGTDDGRLLSDVVIKFIHTFPQIFFVSLPLFAFLLFLFFKRQNGNYYVEHLIFSIHLYCALFILLFIQGLLGEFEGVSWLSWVEYIEWILLLYLVWYFYKALRTFYQQGMAKTILKLCLFVFVSSFLMVFLFIFFFMVSLITV